MKVVEEKYYCDVCKKEVEKEELEAFSIPVKYFYDRDVLTEKVSIEICDECKEALKDSIRSKFAKINLIWCGGVEVEEVVYKNTGKMKGEE